MTGNKSATTLQHVTILKEGNQPLYEFIISVLSEGYLSKRITKPNFSLPLSIQAASADWIIAAEIVALNFLQMNYYPRLNLLCNQFGSHKINGRDNAISLQHYEMLPAHSPEENTATIMEINVQ